MRDRENTATSCHDEKTGFEMFFKFLREFQVRDRVKEALTA
jgi:hypothetical protein